MAAYIICYGCSITKFGYPDREGRLRSMETFLVFNRLDGYERSDVFIVLGAGKVGDCESYGADSISQAHYYFFAKEYKLPVDRILMNPKGKNTVEETLAVWELINSRLTKKDELVLVSSWWHIPRCWIIAKLIFKVLPLKVVWGISSHSFRRILYDLLREIIAIPKSVAELFWLKYRSSLTVKTI